MGAGSVIGAMAGIQDMDRMGGFRRAMPFTFVTFTIGALALAGFPLTAGLLLEGRDPRVRDQPRRLLRGAGDPRLRRAPSSRPSTRSGWCSGSSYGEPVPEARELEGGHLAHGEPMNPMTGEPEDTDVGFPGPEHHVAERAWPMKAAMGPLALLVDRRRLRRDPGRVRRPREVPRADLRGLALPRHRAQHRRRVVWGLVAGGVISILGIGARLVGLPARARHRRARSVERFPLAAPLPREQVVLRRALRGDVRAARSRRSAASAGA